MQPSLPRFSADGATEERWRLVRLARTDGRVRELMRAITREPPDETSPIGEIVWARHVVALHDEWGKLVASVTQELARSPWLNVIAAVLRRAWESEEVHLLPPDGRSIAAADLLSDPSLLAPPDAGTKPDDGPPGGPPSGHDESGPRQVVPGLVPGPPPDA